MGVLMKKHVFLEGGRPLGAFVFYEDSESRPCFKFSIEQKVYEGSLWVEERGTDRKKSFMSNADEMSVDASYKFADHLLEFKSQRLSEKPRPLMTEVPTPPERHLFAVRVRNWQHIPQEQMSKDDLLLAPPWPCEEIVIFFSFAGKEGKPFMPEENLMVKKEGRTITLDLPLSAPYDRIWIGVGEAVKNEALPDLAMIGPNERRLE